MLGDETVLRQTRLLWVLAIVALNLSLSGCDLVDRILNPPSDTAPFPVLITQAIPERPVTRPGESFLSQRFKINYWSGKILISSSIQGDGSIFVDDAINIQVVRPDGSDRVQLIDLSRDCTGTGPDKPQDISDLFLIGKNSVEITLFDACGGSVGSSILWLVNLPESSGQ
jgi:hypothetical protein